MRVRFWIGALLVLIVIGLLAASIGGAFLARMWRGYQMGQAAGEEGALPGWGHRWAPRGGMYGYGGRFGGYRPFGLLRPLLTFVLFLFLFGLMAKAFGFWAWRRAWRATGKDWRQAWAHGPHGHPPHGPMPPRCCAAPESGDEASGTGESAQEKAREQVAKVKPDAGTAESES
jgi:hypothetical protein